MANPGPSTPGEKNETMHLIALLADGREIGALPDTATVGYMIPVDDGRSVAVALEELRNGQAPCAARRVRVVLRPEPDGDGAGQLSPREKEVLQALVDGLSYKMIAARLKISFETVRSHVKVIYAKMAVKNNTSAVAKAIQWGLVAA